MVKGKPFRATGGSKKLNPDHAARMRFSVIAILLLPLTQDFAQSRIDLTGKADAVIGEPFTMVTGVRELPGNRAIVTDQFERAVAVGPLLGYPAFFQ